MAMQSALLLSPLGVSPFKGTQVRAGLPCLPARRRVPVVARCSIQKQSQETRDERSLAARLAMPVAATLAASLLLGAALPDDALAARSGGRVGGSSFRSSAPRSAPSAPPRSSGPSMRSGPSVRNYNYYSAPPLVGGYGYGGYGGGGLTFAPSFGVPLFYGGGFFNILIFMFIASTILGVARSIFNRGRRDDEFDD